MSGNVRKVDIPRFRATVQELCRELVCGIEEGNVVEVMVRNGDSMDYLHDIVDQTRLEPKSVPNKVKNLWKSKTSPDAWVFWLGLEFQNLKAAQQTQNAPLATDVSQVMSGWKKRMEEGQRLLAEAGKSAAVAASTSANVQSASSDVAPAVPSTTAALLPVQPSPVVPPVSVSSPARLLSQLVTPILTVAINPAKVASMESVKGVVSASPPSIQAASTIVMTPSLASVAAVEPAAAVVVAPLVAPAAVPEAAVSNPTPLGGGKRKLQEAEREEQSKQPHTDSIVKSRASSSAPKSTGGSSARQISQVPTNMDHKSCDQCVWAKVDCVPAASGGRCVRCFQRKCACSNALGASAAASQGHKNRKQKTKEIIGSDDEEEQDEAEAKKPLRAANEAEVKKQKGAAEAGHQGASTPKVKEKKKKCTTLADLEAQIVELENENETLRKDAEHNIEELSVALDSYKTLRLEVGSALVGMAQDIAHAMAQAKHASGGATVECPTLFKSYRMERGSRIGPPSLQLHGGKFDWDPVPPSSFQPHRVSIDLDGVFSWGGRVPHDYMVQPGEVLDEVAGWPCDDPTAPLAKSHLVPRHLIAKKPTGAPASLAAMPGGSSSGSGLTVNPAHLHAPVSTVLATQQAAGATATQGTHPKPDADLAANSTNITQQQDPRQATRREDSTHLIDSRSPLTELESTGDVIRDEPAGPLAVKVKHKVQLRERVVVEICTWSHAKAAAASPVPSSSRRTRSSR
ncbi:hypothetical protein BJ165DRAFT_1405117 [Panaeolus papilionaceus]|nr:hypothetical protein BJ165DRAFT_1405117 [Panaeolus papilionaceus]